VNSKNINNTPGLVAAGEFVNVLKEKGRTTDLSTIIQKCQHTMDHFAIVEEFCKEHDADVGEYVRIIVDNASIPVKYLGPGHLSSDTARALYMELCGGNDKSHKLFRRENGEIVEYACSLAESKFWFYIESNIVKFLKNRTGSSDPSTSDNLRLLLSPIHKWDPVAVSVYAGFLPEIKEKYFTAARNILRQDVKLRQAIRSLGFKKAVDDVLNWEGQ
jgi:hypothetical protein